MSASKISKKFKKRHSRSVKRMTVSSTGPLEYAIEKVAVEPIRPLDSGLGPKMGTKPGEKGDTEQSPNFKTVTCKTSQTEMSIPQEFGSFEEKLIFMENDEKIKALNNRLLQMNAKLFATKNMNISLKQELNKAQKILSSEIGDNVKVAELLNHPNGWRGRAEQICQLQQKVAELQNEIHGQERANQNSLDKHSETDRSASLKSDEKKRKTEIESATKELMMTKMALENTQKKLEMTKLRIAGLDKDLTVSRRHVLLLNEKRLHDDQLIMALNNRIKDLERRNDNVDIQIQRERVTMEVEIAGVRNDLQNWQAKAENLQEKLNKKEKELEILNSSQPSIKELLTDSATSNESNEYLIIGMAAEAEKEKLLELVAVLNRRVDKERQEMGHLADSLRFERKRAAKLEVKVQKLELEKLGASKNRYRKPNMKSMQTADEENADEIQYKIELLQEECLALKDRLATVQQDKSADLLAFKEMLEQSRRIFQDAYRIKSSTSILAINESPRAM